MYSWWSVVVPRAVAFIFKACSNILSPSHDQFEAPWLLAAAASQASVDRVVLASALDPESSADQL
jgi:hypothetical protein